MPISIGVKMDNQGIISRYLKDKSNEGEEVIALLQEQKKILSNSKKSSILLNDEYFSLIFKLARNSKGKIKYHAITILSNIGFCMDAKNFYELCRIAAESSNDKDGNVRKASLILIKNINALMMVLPLITKLQNASKAEVNLFYESFRTLFYRLHSLLHNQSGHDIRKSILRSLEIMLPKFYDMAKFWNDKEDIILANKVKEELGKEPK